MKKGDWFLIGFVLLIVSWVFDKEIFRAISVLFTSSITSIMLWVGSVVLFILILIFSSYLLWDKKKIIYLLGGIVFSYIVSLILKYLIQKPRPLDAMESGFGFPSSHATIYFFLFAFMSEEFEKYKFYFLGIVLLVSFSRLYLGVHYLSDLIGGGLLGVGLYLGYKKWLKI